MSKYFVWSLEFEIYWKGKVSSVSSDSIVKGIIDDIINTAVKTAEVYEQKNKIFTTLNIQSDLF
jgi:hypothetical protein